METISDEQRGDDLIPPKKTGAIELLLKANPKHPIAEKYLAELKIYQSKFEEKINSLPKKPKIELPELKPIDVESFYNLFKDAFKFYNGKEFDESANNFESRKLARTLMAYFIRKKSFLRSPLLNFKSEPDLNKGIMLIGGYGVGKSSIIDTFNKILNNSIANNILVDDINGNKQLIYRYKLGFKSFTANEVKRYYKLIRQDSKSDEDYYLHKFFRRHENGVNYYDDLMTEEIIKDFGENVNIFKNILEERYSKKQRTLISINYVGDSVDSTLDAYGLKYGDRLYDRAFEMYNIIELKGDSLRK